MNCKQFIAYFNAHMSQLFMSTKVVNPRSYPCGLMERLPVGQDSYGPIAENTKTRLEYQVPVSFETLELWYRVWSDLQDDSQNKEELFEMATYGIYQCEQSYCLSVMDVLDMISSLYNEAIPADKLNDPSLKSLLNSEPKHFQRLRVLGRSIMWRHTLPEYTDIQGLIQTKDNCGAMVVLAPRPGVN